ncbi:hypothetical protein AVEN_147004-1 [Araneus ventricosus]|uniref:Uncharacterized protein n=1 Tax=Araneus ventricosus TaxID=182803 RepID=A0A4Y2LAW8_ARAVE|nr:hypothetical protein AVEN_147004-1 [Araneus ventricosus]
MIIELACRQQEHKASARAKREMTDDACTFIALSSPLRMSKIDSACRTKLLPQTLYALLTFTVIIKKNNLVSQLPVNNNKDPVADDFKGGKVVHCTPGNLYAVRDFIHLQCEACSPSTLQESSIMSVISCVIQN